MHELLLGAIAAASLIAGLIFLRYWMSTGDPFFAYFTASFWLEALSRIHMALTASWNEDLPIHYLTRLLSYGLILWAIWDKNRPRKR